MKVGVAIVVLASGCGPNASGSHQPGSPMHHQFASIEPLGATWPPAPNERLGWLGPGDSSFRFSAIPEHAVTVEKGCPFAPTPMPPCSGDIDAIPTFEASERVSETDGHLVTLIGPLFEDTGSDYELPRIGARLCAVLHIGSAETGGVYMSPAPWKWDGVEPTPFWCCGDASGLCCGVSWSPYIVARGVYHAGDPSGGIPPTLGDPLFCAVQPGSIRLVRPPQGGSP